MKKKLITSKDIEYILDFLKPNPDIPLETSNSSLKIIKKNLENQLRKQYIYPEMIDELKNQIKKYYYESIIQAGESVGVISAQSLGEQQTQSTLNSFHTSGMSEKTVTTGIPRFQELLNATKNPRNVNHKIYFHNNNVSIKKLRKHIKYNIVGLMLKDITDNFIIFLNKEEELFYKTYKILYNNNFEKFKHCIRVEINKEKMFEFNLSLKEISKFIDSEFSDLYCVYSPFNMGFIDIFVDTSCIELPENRLSFIDAENVDEIYLEECVQPALEKLYIAGIPGITELFYAKEKNNLWYIETNGFNSKIISNQYNSFKKLLSLKIIDYTRTLSNNVWDIYETLGIEAAREFLIDEFEIVIEGINNCHTKLLVERMTYNGSICSINRYTLKKDDSGPMGKASFEETMDNFLNAASQGEIEPTKGVSSSIICGKKANFGTGVLDLRVDISRLPSIQDVEVEVNVDVEVEKEIEESIPLFSNLKI